MIRASTVGRVGLIVMVVWTVCTRGVAAQDGVGFRMAFGWHELVGEMGDAFDGAVDAEFSILVPVHRIRVGGGANWASFRVSGQESSFSRLRFHGLVGLPFRLGPRLRPYLEARYTFQRFRPEDDRFFGGEDRLLRDFVASGSGFEGVAGVEIGLGARTSLDLSGAVGTFSVSPDLAEEGLGPLDSGTAWRLQAGVSWFPTHRSGGEG